MFIGHYAVGFASQRVAPRTPFVWLVAAPLFLDLLWPIFLVIGIESVRIVPGYTKVVPLDLHDYPWSHSLAAAVVWSVAFAGAYVAVPRHRDDRRGALVLGLAVFSHWILDWITHAPDMPLYPGSETRVGLGLWNSMAGTLVVEVSLFVVAVVLYARGTRPLRAAGTWSFWGLVAFLSAIHVANTIGPPPPSVAAIEVLAMCTWLLVPWAAWIGRTRAVVGVVAAGMLFLAACDGGEDDLLDRLNAIPGMHAEEDADAEDIPAGYRFFQLEYRQPVDHARPDGATFTQYLNLLVDDVNAPMVEFSGGYGAARVPAPHELMTMTAGNQVTIEHRYFAPSRPEPTDWTFLDIEQAAGDFHRVNAALRGIFPGVWIATGGSKGGMAALFFRRFYPDDVDVTVPYVAPIMTAAPDPRFVPYLEAIGEGEAPGCTQALFDFQRAALEAIEEIEAIVDEHAGAESWTFQLLGKRQAIEHAILELPFTFWQYGGSGRCGDVPEVGAPAEELYAFLDEVQGVGTVSDGVVTYFVPYYVQSARQFGWPAYRTSHVADVMTFEDTDVPAVYAASSGAELDYDGGAAMADVLAWLETSCDRVLFVYAENDPWSAGMVTVPEGKDCHRFVIGGGNHRSKIAALGAEEKAEVVGILEGWIGRPVVIAGARARAAEVEARERPPL